MDIVDVVDGWWSVNGGGVSGWDYDVVNEWDMPQPHSLVSSPLEDWFLLNIKIRSLGLCMEMPHCVDGGWWCIQRQLTY